MDNCQLNYGTQIFMIITPTNVTYNVTMVFLEFRELVNVLNNYCFYTEQMPFGAKQHIIVTFFIVPMNI